MSGVFILPEHTLVQHAILALQGVAASLALIEAGCLRGPLLRCQVTTALLTEIAAAGRARLGVGRAVELLLMPNKSGGSGGGSGGRSGAARCVDGVSTHVCVV